MKILDIIQIAVVAGEEILEVYHSAFTVEHKADDSPLTEADKRSHEVICNRLKDMNPDIPILSEEGKDQPYSVRREWDAFWLVDPLDGTKEFVKRNGEFTVNIAFVKKGVPVMGVIYAPVLDVVYFGQKEKGAFRLEQARSFFHNLSVQNGEDRLWQGAEKLPFASKKRTYTVIASRSHLSLETKEYIESLKEKHGEVDTVSAGSSLKLCRVAEGAADEYPRFAPTMEWDTAAGQAIVEASGGFVLNSQSGERLVYNKEDLTNPWFIAKRSVRS